MTRRDVLRYTLLIFGWTSPAVADAATEPVPVPDDDPKLQRAEALRIGYLRLRDEGQDESAITLAEEACTILADELGPDSHHLAACLDDLAMLYQKQGQHEKARSLFTRALAIRERVLGPEHPTIASSLSNLAQLYQEQGQLEKARVHFERALSIEEAVSDIDHIRVASRLVSLAQIRRDQGQDEEAERLLRRALSIQEKSLGSNDPRVAITLSDLAALYMAQRQYTKAEPAIERMLSIAVDVFGPRHVGLSAGLRDMAIIQLDLGRPASALELLRQSLDIEEESLIRSVVIAEDSRRLADASRLLDSTHQALSLHLQAAPADRAAAELALTTLLRRKGRMQDLCAKCVDKLRRSIPEAHQHLLGELSRALAGYSAFVHHGPGGDSVETFRARLATLQRELDDLWGELAKRSSRARALVEPMSIRHVQASLPGDAALIEYVKYKAVFGAGSSAGAKDERYAAYIVFSDRFEWVELGPAVVVDEHGEALREAVIRNADTDGPGRALYDTVMKPVISRLGLTTRLFISPDGNLNLIPFDALIDEYDGHLIERFHLHYLSSGRDFRRVEDLPPAGADGPIVLLANPAGTDLPGTEHEATLLGSLLGSVVMLTRWNATEGELRAHERPRILHIATHGHFNADRARGDNPMLHSWLELATPPTLPAPPDDPSTTDDLDDPSLLDDGKLTAYEVSGWDLRGTELVTLSACDTAQGTYQQGEGILGLRRAFAIAGAQTQVMSLWKVSDTATAKLMASYYRRLLAGEGRSEAMRNTQLELLRDPATRHPRDWAAFVVVGEWGPLSSATAPPKADPPPIDSRPRGCQATVGAPSDDLATIFLLLPSLSLALTRRRRRRPRA